MTVDGVQTTLNKSLTLMQAIVLVGGVIVTAAGTWFSLNLRVAALEWRMQDIAPTTKDYQAVKQDVAELKFLAQESIQDRVQIHKVIDDRGVLIQDLRDRMSRVEGRIK